MYAGDAEKLLREAMRIQEEEDARHGGHKQSFISKYVFSIDHKWIGIQYGMTALCFLLFGFSLMLLMRLQLGWPGHSFSIMKILGESRAPGGILLPEAYNQLGAMHGTIMVFLAIVPLAVGAFGNYLVPLMIGAPDMAFPRLNMASYWCYLPGGLVMLASFAATGGTAQSGWTSYPPLSDIATEGQTWWLVGMIFLITSSLLGSVNFIVTIIQLRAKGMTWMRLPFFVWAQFVTSFLLLLAFPPLEAAGVLQLMDRVAHTSFFLPSGLVVSGTKLAVAGGGNPLLWQHLFWFLAHPEVYVLILPAMGIIGEIIANNTRKPLWGYKSLVGAVTFLGFMSFVVWAHHMFMTGMGTVISAFFQTTTMIISIPSVIILTALLMSLWGGSIRFNVPMLFALAFLPMFGIGGLTGLPLGLAATDIHLHDTYYVIGHFHYVVAPGTIFAMFAGIYYWFPKITGKKMNEFLGKVHFWGSFVAINGIFMPMFAQGLAGVSRRLYDGGLQYHHAKEIAAATNPFMSMSAWTLLAFQLPFILNFFWSMAFGKKADANFWQATTLEWAATTSPPLGHGNFAIIPVVYRGPYEYSNPDYTEADYLPQHHVIGEPPATSGGGMLTAAAVAQREA
jgi:cytochrome c oxidase subunit 1